MPASANRTNASSACCRDTTARRAEVAEQESGPFTPEEARKIMKNFDTEDWAELRWDVTDPLGLTLSLSDSFARRLQATFRELSEKNDPAHKEG
jgi:hypothetical protein